MKGGRKVGRKEENEELANLKKKIMNELISNVSA